MFFIFIFPNIPITYLRFTDGLTYLLRKIVEIITHISIMHVESVKKIQVINYEIGRFFI